MFGSEQKRQDQQFNRSVSASEEQNDTNAAMSMSDSSRTVYDPQVSAMLLEMQRRFLKWKIVKEKDSAGREEYKWKCSEKYEYKEPYNDESLSFMEEDEERKLLNLFGMTMSEVKQFADKYDLDWHLPFNHIVNVRENFLVNSRTTGRPGKLAKSQFTDTNANITRQVKMEKPKGLLGGLFG